jgi:hypothetical protein
MRHYRGYSGPVVALWLVVVVKIALNRTQSSAQVPLAEGYITTTLYSTYHHTTNQRL